MGWETGVSLGAGAIKSYANIDTAQAESKATAQSAEYTAQNMANQTSRQEGSLETSFLKGGIALGGAGGAGPSAFFTQAATQGTTDINRTISNANASINNTINAARVSSLDTIASSWGKIPASTITDTLSKAWNGLSGNPDPSPTGTAILDTSALQGGFGTGDWSIP